MLSFFGKCHQLTFLLLCPQDINALVTWFWRGREVQKCTSLMKKVWLQSVNCHHSHHSLSHSVDRKYGKCFQIPLGSEPEGREAASFQRTEWWVMISLNRTGNWAHFCMLIWMLMPLRGLNVCDLPHQEGSINRKPGALGRRHWNS